jgi:phosphate transport system permease protein
LHLQNDMAPNEARSAEPHRNLAVGPLTRRATAPVPPSRQVRGQNTGDRVWNAVLGGFGGVVLLVAGVIVLVLGRIGYPAAAATGPLRFLAGRNWDPVQDAFGALPFIYGTLVTSALAVVFAVPVAIGLGIFICEMASARLGRYLSFPIELLAGIPSVVFGLWGLFVLVPWVRGTLEPLLGKTLGFIPFFSGPPIGLGYLSAGLILAIMILPTVTSVTVEVLRTVPGSLREAAFALGATRWEVVRTSVLPYGKAGILGASILGLGRALGETMAVTMVIGNSPAISASLFAPGYSLPSVIANEFAEATGHMHTAALAALGLILLGLALLLNALARVLVNAVAGGPARVSV